jgi:uncharacterized membrane protein YphA (DoxX/SURF4 family)
MNNLSKYAPVVLRVGIALVFVWFAINQMTSINSWLGVVPAWAHSLFGSSTAVVYLNAWFEIMCAALLIAGLQTRWVGLILCLHLIQIASGFGLAATGVRDFGLAFGALTIFLQGAGMWSLDSLFARKALANQDVSQM